MGRKQRRKQRGRESIPTSDLIPVPFVSPDHPLRLVCVRTSPHTSRGKYRDGSTGAGSDGVLRIATNLLDVPAEIVAGKSKVGQVKGGQVKGVRNQLGFGS